MALVDPMTALARRASHSSLSEAPSEEEEEPSIVPVSVSRSKYSQHHVETAADPRADFCDQAASVQGSVLHPASSYSYTYLVACVQRRGVEKKDRSSNPQSGQTILFRSIPVFVALAHSQTQPTDRSASAGEQVRTPLTTTSSA